MQCVLKHCKKQASSSCRHGQYIDDRTTPQFDSKENWPIPEAISFALTREDELRNARRSTCIAVCVMLHSHMNIYYLNTFLGADSRGLSGVNGNSPPSIAITYRSSSVPHDMFISLINHSLNNHLPYRHGLCSERCDRARCIQL